MDRRRATKPAPKASAAKAKAKAKQSFSPVTTPATTNEKPRTLSITVHELDEMMRTRTQLESDLEALNQDNAALKLKLVVRERDLAELKGLNDELLKPPGGGASHWVRGILPGNRLIKTNLKTGGYQTITKEEWDSLA